MIWKILVNQLAITSRRRGLVTAVIYGLSLAVRFTSAAGEEVEIPMQSLQKTHTEIFINDHSSLPYQKRGFGSAQPVLARQGWSLKASMPVRSPECPVP